MDVEPFVALQANQLRVEELGENLRHLGLADARLPFEKERPAEAQGEEDRRGQAAAGEVALPPKGFLQRVDRGEGHYVDASVNARRAITVAR